MKDSGRILRLVFSVAGSVPQVRSCWGTEYLYGQMHTRNTAMLRTCTHSPKKEAKTKKKVRRDDKVARTRYGVFDDLRIDGFVFVDSARLTCAPSANLRNDAGRVLYVDPTWL